MFWSHWKILGAKVVTWRKPHPEDPQRVDATQSLVARATWRLGFVQPCFMPLLILTVGKRAQAEPENLLYQFTVDGL
jgi:hypothetical protein